MSRAHQASNVKEIYMGKFVIVAYRPRPGKEKELLRLNKDSLAYNMYESEGKVGTGR